MKVALALLLSGLVSGTMLCVAEECASLNYKECFRGDVPSGSVRYEYRIKDCTVFETKSYKTNYECTTEGTLIKTSQVPIDGAWKAEDIRVPRTSGTGEYGTYHRRERLLWDEGKTELVREKEVIKDVMVSDFGAGNGYFKLDEESKTRLSYYKDHDEVVIVSRKSTRRKSKYTRNMWLTNTEETVEGFEAIQ